MLNIEECIERMEVYKGELLHDEYQREFTIPEVNSILEYLHRYQEVESTVNK